MDISRTKPVRFSSLVEKSGKPTVYLPLSEPTKDQRFMRAVNEQRVLTIKQEPTSTHKDFGIVGFLKEKFVTYLLFPKTLRPFTGQRVIGIKYDLLKEGNVAAARPRRRTASERSR